MTSLRAKTSAEQKAAPLVDIPHLRVARRGVAPQKPKFNLNKKYTFRYDSKEQIEQPHVMKFSGGRSSGMLLFTLLENGILKPERGDVVIFNNTSAEHPATYEFVARCKERTEKEYGIPFLWTEFQTYEDSVMGDWRRLPTYRLTQPHEIADDCPHGYSCGGEVFEELLSWKRFLPTLFKRICTQEMKLFVTQAFLRDWFACKPEIDRQGHWHGESQMDDATVVRLHERHQGTTPPEVLLEKAAYVRSRPHIREAQQYSDYSPCTTARMDSTLQDKVFGGKVALAGDNCMDYVTFIGLRADEPMRIHRMKARNYGRKEEADCEEEKDPHITAPEGEYVYAPLADMGVSKADVCDFWQKQPKNTQLLLPDDAGMSNCVFCFLKGTKNLAHVLANQDSVEKNMRQELRARPGTPGDIHWWVAMEKKYGRDLKRENRVITSDKEVGQRPIIGFWGMNSKMSYKWLANYGLAPDEISAENMELPCDCTD